MSPSLSTGISARTVVLKGQQIVMTTNRIQSAILKGQTSVRFKIQTDHHIEHSKALN